MSTPIEDYGLIGDCQSAALVAKNGSIDWLCLPRFDSPACFAALLGTCENGHWQICPVDEHVEVQRRYRPDTLILETEFRVASGSIKLIDFMPIRGTDPDVVRIVVGLRGTVRMKAQLILRFDYGSVVPWVRRIDGGIRGTAGPDTVFVWTPVELRGKDLRTVSEFEVKEGERVPFTLTWIPTHRQAPSRQDPEKELATTEQWWRDWSGPCKYTGRWKEAVVRSLITLKGLIYQPTGGIVAAPTTSLPEHLGGVRNWDYRYCWLRDSTFTLYALMVGGYLEEAKAWREWLLNAVAGTPSEVNIMYGLSGERRLMETELDWLPGYEGSKPVRTGNAAYRQHQLDVYGETMDTLHLARRLGVPPSKEAWNLQRALVRFLETDWDKPDEGLWEVRGPRRHFTHSKVMAWVAMDRAVKAVTHYGLSGPVERWRLLRDEIREQIWREGFNQELNSFVWYYGSKEPDASLLMLPEVGFIRADDPAMKGTVDFIQRRLLRDHFLQRYPTAEGVDGLPGGEGAFLLCTFWLADNLALQGRLQEAEEIFERLLDCRNDLGLLAEEYDPEQKRMLGNFPQAFSHVGLINTARNLDQKGGPAEDRPRDDD